jgi:NTE family protein
VEIEGEAYWDGGLTSNPPLLPMVEHCAPRDVLLIQINPLAAMALPTSARQIRNRLAEIVFGRPLVSELETLARLARLARSPLAWPHRANRRLARHRLHLIDGSAELAALDPNTRIDPDWSLLVRLRDQGRMAAEAWLCARLGRRVEAAALAAYSVPASTSPIASSRMSSA